MAESRAREVADLIGMVATDAEVASEVSTLNTRIDAVPQSKNLLYNGAMQVHQRGTSTTGITTANYYTADRWSLNVNSLGTWTQSVETDAPTGSGFSKSLKMLCTTDDAAPAAGDFLLVKQTLEGQDVQRIAKGTASAQQLTLSFWVKSNVTGTFVCEIVDSDNSREVSLSYTINASATWEYKTITFPADTTGAFTNDNNSSLVVSWWLGAGSTFSSGTLQTSWGTIVNANRVVGQTNLAAATNNYWQITGVQLEVGDTATDFEHLPFGVELARCQRYYQTPSHGWGNFYSSSECKISFDFATTMRDTPTLIVRSPFTNIIEQNGVNTLTPTSISGNYRDKSGAVLQFFGMSGATAQNGAFFRVGTSPSAIAFSAEL